ncbi:5-formyltetrahydrofolate cyclo-ligase [Rhizobium rhizogenes]|uniref:5-formyltetrahydrofolate cyclo-ligase n=1 Tax=Rhizobium rhizogenes TaxID=359 RepID=A0AAN2A679_RHIRH|nr:MULTISPECIES: 5-formyltetrahydrofolate cyclo-ligase [Rhizobium/Agrobacterium group]AQS64536.1 5-formyltetrahydrofolate cyclo-ligase [Rhizobium rhizogenes]MCZ7441615.1 5-formyltetrahydrofolate cyclo-ligase [Rhizobium rhizogenes]NSZ81053.1 5-formyltetrahydrofolate cyclo-ligase [Agrobacterium tumefaciens]OAM62556.1 5-formyltetrahydrofolate cyclo-ligase [Rhizobium rhizogenes]CAD0215410.1 5-formyltetrahydrofolate cyclo-ligase [Rhizobium rhizogenes]
MAGDVAEKARLRGERLAARDALTPAERQQKSRSMAVRGAPGISFAPGAVISGFMPIRSEADIRPLMEMLRERGGRLALPVVLDRETIVFRSFEADTPLVKTGFGTTGPGEDAAVLDPDILLVPLSAFDGRGQRIGYGAGHYDRAIARLHAKGREPVLIGVAFDCQEVPSIPAEPHDVSLHAILTESGLRWFSSPLSTVDPGQKAL